MTGVASIPRVGWRRPLIPPHLRRRALAAVLAGVGVVLALAALRRPADTTAIAVAARDLPAGSRLTAGDVRLLDVPRTVAPDGASTTSGGIVGRVLADPVRAREPLTDVRLGASRQPQGLGPGQVAAPIRLIDPDIGPLLHPGATVDVLAAPDTPDGSAGPQVAARLVARGVRILAVPKTASTGGSAQGTLAVVAVSRSDAQAVAGAEANGRLSVVFEPG